MQEDNPSLETVFMKAVRASNSGDKDKAFRLFKKVLSVDPRIPEPRLEIAMILFERGDLEEAEAQAREALEQLERGGQWTEMLTTEQLVAHACNLIAEILSARSVRDEMLTRDSQTVRALWQEAWTLVDRAAKLDPENPDVMANYYSYRKAKIFPR